MHHIHQFLNLGDRMDFGALMFFTDYAISAVDSLKLTGQGLFS